MISRCCAVAAAGSLEESWPIESFENYIYHVRVYGPNGFFRELSVNAGDLDVAIACEYERPGNMLKKLTGNIDLKITKMDAAKSFTVEIRDNAYKNKSTTKVLAVNTADNGNGHTIILNLNKSFGWYDFSALIKCHDSFERRYAGHVETGKESFTDPVIGRV
ncbi:MAG: phospholipase domain-containing protein [Ginsengibacter sp.]